MSRKGRPATERDAISRARRVLANTANFVRLASIPDRGQKDFTGAEFPGLTGPKMADLFLEDRHIPRNSIRSDKLAGVSWEDVNGRPDGIITREELNRILSHYATRSWVFNNFRKSR